MQRYLIADLFCGAGGSSTGAERAVRAIGGQMELVAVNHWPIAIETHQKNHPSARHYIEDISVADPERIVPEGYLDLLMASPECRFYSRARGGRPVHDQGRMNPWAVHRWLTSLDVRCVLIENVPEFVDWGPLLADGRPDKPKKGVYFQAWIQALWELGYSAEWKYLNAADYGDATTRTRFFMIARKDGAPIVWPERTHTPDGAVEMFDGPQKWRSAREIIEWSNPGHSLLDDPRYKSKPLSEKTRRRIARGLQRFGGPLAGAYISLLGLEAKGEGGGSETRPFVMGKQSSPALRGLDEPIPAVTTESASVLVQPTARKLEYECQMCGERFTEPDPNGDGPGAPCPNCGEDDDITSSWVAAAEPFLLGQQSGASPRSTDEPIPTVATDGAISLTQPMLTQYYGQSSGSPIDAPVPSMTTKARFGVVNPLVVPYGPRAEARSADEPLPTIMTKDRLGVASPMLIEVNHGEDNKTGRREKSVDQPLSTVTTHRTTALVNPILVQTSQTGGNGGYARPIDQPIPTLTTSNDMGVVEPTAEPFIVPQFGEAPGQPPRVHDVDEPLPAVTSHGAGAVVRPSIIEPVLTPASGEVDPRRLVLVNGEPYLLDIRFRMLTNDELARAMGFTDEESRYEFVGNVGEVTKQIGNAVPVNTAAALVGAVLS